MKTKELKHLAAYLPYKVKIDTGTCILYLNTETIQNVYYNLKSKLILHPWSDLTKEIEVNGKKIIPIEEIKKLFIMDLEYGIINYISGLYGLYSADKKTIIPIYLNNKILDECYVGIYNKLLEYHIDINDWISQGIAIDINTLNNEEKSI